MTKAASADSISAFLKSEEELRYTDDKMAGIQRKKRRDKFSYWNATGKRITDPVEIRRIDALAIPPNYIDVWICPDPAGHIQATARDARGRKQYCYHKLWRSSRDANKFDRMLDFGKTLPLIRAHVKKDLALPGLPREKIIATVVSLLEKTLIRIGNQEYARNNKSYGLTTLRNRHVELKGNDMRFRFRGKSGMEHDIHVNDERLAKVVRRCLHLPGQELFQYLDESGQRHRIDSSDINAYLRNFGTGQFTAKDYRTWAGSVLTLFWLQNKPDNPDKDARSITVNVVRDVAAVLGNTPAVCRKCYIHPDILQTFLVGSLPPQKKSSALSLVKAEANLLGFLENKTVKSK